MQAAIVATICEGLSTYTGIAGAYCLARHAIKDQELQVIDETLSEAAVSHPDAGVKALLREMHTRIVAEKATALRPHRQWINAGFWLFGMSGLFFAAAIAIHVW